VLSRAAADDEDLHEEQANCLPDRRLTDRTGLDELASVGQRIVRRTQVQHTTISLTSRPLAPRIRACL
jgi:hypothetical protein